jgi:hypothetical protein
MGRSLNQEQKKSFLKKNKETRKAKEKLEENLA